MTNEEKQVRLLALDLNKIYGYMGERINALSGTGRGWGNDARYLALGGKMAGIKMLLEEAMQQPVYVFREQDGLVLVVYGDGNGNVNTDTVPIIETA